MDKERFKKGKKASVLGIIGNLFLMIIKGSIGFVTNSQAMIADFFNSAADIFSSIMTFIGNKIASVPSDEDHNLGHGKAEYIYSMLISIVMIFMAFKVIVDSVSSLIKRSSFSFSYFLVIVCIITIIIKFSLYLYTNKIAKKYNNLLIKANSKDHINDCIITTFNLIAVLLGLHGIYFVDGIVGCGVGIWIFITGIKIFFESYDVLMDKSISKETKEKVYKIIKEHPEIEKVSHFNSTPVGYRYQVSLTIFVDGNISTFESHAIADNLEKEICKKIPEIYLVVIHVNPIETVKAD